VSPSYESFQVGSQHRVHAVRAGSGHERVHPTSVLHQVVTKCLERHVQSNVTPEAKAVGHCLGGGGHSNVDAINDAGHHTVLERFSARANDLELRIGELRHPGVTIDENPHRVRNLSGQPVNVECAEQADRSVAHPLGNLGKRVMLGDGCVDEAIEATINALEDATLTEALEVGSWYSGAGEVPGADRALLGKIDEFLDL